MTSFAQLPEQLVSPAPQVVPHVPDEQTLPSAHVFLHAPQLPLSARVLTSQPFAGLPSQSAKPGLHAPIAHTPAPQLALALAKLQRTPQPPQLFTSLAPVAVSQPLPAAPSQSPKPAAHAPTTQLRAAHALIEAFASAHTLVHDPQCWASAT